MADKGTQLSTNAQNQTQSASGEKDWKKRNAVTEGEGGPEGGEKQPKDDEPIFFDTTIAKLVERENEETGEKEWVEVLSDNLYPGEKLKRAVDEEKAAEKEKEARKSAFDAADDRKKDSK